MEAVYGCPGGQTDRRTDVHPQGDRLSVTGNMDAPLPGLPDLLVIYLKGTRKNNQVNFFLFSLSPSIKIQIYTRRIKPRIFPHFVLFLKIKIKYVFCIASLRLWPILIGFQRFFHDKGKSRKKGLIREVGIVFFLLVV